MLGSRLIAVALVGSLAACGAGGKDAAAAPSAEQTVAQTVAGSTLAPSSSEGHAPESPAAPDGRACGADKVGRWLNVLPTSEVKDAIAEAVGDRPIRYYAQGDPVTMDFSPARLNAELGADGRIKRFRCA